MVVKFTIYAGMHQVYNERKTEQYIYYTIKLTTTLSRDVHPELGITLTLKTED